MFSIVLKFLSSWGIKLLAGVGVIIGLILYGEMKEKQGETSQQNKDKSIILDKILEKQKRDAEINSPVDGGVDARRERVRKQRDNLRSNT